MRFPWLKTAWFDLGFILLPSFFSVVLAWVLASHADATVTPLTWFLLVVCIDVLHVYGTLFRTYFNKEEWKKNKDRYMWIPFCIWIFGVMLYGMGSSVFWSVMAYIAVFHFVRQQYGFMRLYARGDIQAQWERRLDQAMVYLATLYPVAHWHSHMPVEFHWLIEDDFLVGLPEVVSKMLGVVYGMVSVMFFVNEGRKCWKKIGVNVPKLLVMTGTGLSWYFGIVYFRNDLAFTITNVISHGVPYLALVWITTTKHYGSATHTAWASICFKTYTWPLFLLVLFGFAYMEEGLWDALVWRDHKIWFEVFYEMPQVVSKGILVWLVPLLALPQVTHYILDGLIWKNNSTVS